MYGVPLSPFSVKITTNLKRFQKLNINVVYLKIEWFSTKLQIFISDLNKDHSQYYQWTKQIKQKEIFK